ncbi:MAG TPA: oligosaccharide flippase family protein [Gemmatimonadaceae bacterium]
MTTSSLAEAPIGPPRKSPLGILRNAGWLTGTRLAGDFLSFGLFVVLSRYFGPSGIGQFAYGFAIASFVSIFVGLGLDDFGVREFARLETADSRQLLGKLVVSQLGLLVIVGVALGGFLLATKASPTVAGIIVVLSIQQAVLAIARTFFAPAYAQQAMATPALMEVGCRAAGMLITLALVVLSHASLVVAVVGYPIGALALLAFAIPSGVRRTGGLSLRIAPREALRLVLITWPFGASEMVYLLYTRADLVILTWMRGDATAGIYASSLKFYEVSTLPVFFLGFAAYPALSRLFEERAPRLASAVGRLFLSSLLIAGLIAWGMVFVIPSVLVPLLGDKFSSAGPVVQLMAVFVVLTAVEATATRVLLAVHLQVIKFKLQLASTVLNVVLDLLLIPRFGIMGAIVATAAALVMVDVFYLRALATRLVSAPIITALVAFVVPLLAAFAAGTMATVLSWPQWLAAFGSLGIFLAVALLSGLGALLREALGGQLLGGLPADH